MDITKKQINVIRNFHMLNGVICGPHMCTLEIEGESYFFWLRSNEIFHAGFCHKKLRQRNVRVYNWNTETPIMYGYKTDLKRSLDVLQALQEAPK